MTTPGPNSQWGVPPTYGPPPTAPQGVPTGAPQHPGAPMSGQVSFAQSRIGAFLLRDVFTLTASIALLVMAFLMPFSRFFTAFSIEGTDGTTFTLKGNGSSEFDVLSSSAMFSDDASGLDGLIGFFAKDFIEEITRTLSILTQDMLGKDIPVVIAVTLLCMLAAVLMMSRNPRLGAAIGIGATVLPLIYWIIVMVMLGKLSAKMLEDEGEFYHVGMGAAMWLRLVALIIMAAICIAVLVRDLMRNGRPSTPGVAQQAGLGSGPVAGGPYPADPAGGPASPAQPSGPHPQARSGSFPAAQSGPYPPASGSS